MYDLLKRTLGNGPVYVTLGNHDTYDQYALLLSLGIRVVIDASQSPGCSSFAWGRAGQPVQLVSIDFMLSSGNVKDVFNRNYNHVASLWELEQWLPQSAVAQARSHYGAYSVQRTDGLRVISLNTDFCKRDFVSNVKLNLYSVCDPGYRYGSALCLDFVAMLIGPQPKLFQLYQSYATRQLGNAEVLN